MGNLRQLGIEKTGRLGRSFDTFQRCCQRNSDLMIDLMKKMHKIIWILMLKDKELKYVVYKQK